MSLDSVASRSEEERNVLDMGSAVKKIYELD